MATDALRVCMFGEFSLSMNGQTINDSDNRSKKIWLLLPYMIYFRNRGISQEELIELLWGDRRAVPTRSMPSRPCFIAPAVCWTGWAPARDTH